MYLLGLNIFVVIDFENNKWRLLKVWGWKNFLWLGQELLISANFTDSAVVTPSLPRAYPTAPKITNSISKTIDDATILALDGMFVSQEHCGFKQKYLFNSISKFADCTLRLSEQIYRISALRTWTSCAEHIIIKMRHVEITIMATGSATCCSLFLRMTIKSKMRSAKKMTAQQPITNIWVWMFT